MTGRRALTFRCRCARLQEPALAAAEGSAAQDLAVNAIGLAVFTALFLYDRQAGEARIEQRKAIRWGAGRVRPLLGSPGALPCLQPGARRAHSLHGRRCTAA
jgi:hypothetical protein